ncbi:MAG: flagellar biosynthesis protein FliQ [Rhodobacteraceae bacterium]|jgi:flagellar biosynthesis protein FliQ|nr:flagellar biosynthesis protein FliQ [Paracoccaceae bacterium]MCF8513408.1 flagellar biosynthesis protein FliQ [Paracoccaceae bacterium]MCF8517692.1 flagellar biosynthesis protein FliQ [Paracoccaceae bacterium]
MDFDSNIEHLRLAFWNIVLVAGPVLGVALVIGLVIGVLQAATSINEATLSFVPKLGVVMLTMALSAGYMLSTMSDYFTFVFQTIATLK